MKATTTTQSRFALFALLVGALALSGCGARKTARDTGSYESASRTVLDKGMDCNQFSSTTTKLSGKVRTYIQPDGTEREDMLRLRITGLPNTFDTNSNFKLKFFRWKALPDGTTQQDTQNPIEFRIESPGPIPLTGYMTQVSIADITQIKRNYAINSSGAEDFFKQVDILLFDVDYSWDVLRVVLYEATSATTSKTVAYVDVLMPAISADPEKYASDHPPVLAELHPFWAQMGSNKDFSAIAESWCF